MRKVWISLGLYAVLVGFNTGLHLTWGSRAGQVTPFLLLGLGLVGILLRVDRAEEDLQPPRPLVSLGEGLLAAVVVLPMFVSSQYLLSRIGILSFSPVMPDNLVRLVAFEVIVIAIPEELFFRGMLQPALDSRWKPRRRLFGAAVGPSLFVTSALFALAHLPIQRSPIALLTFFPALLFGVLYARRRSIVGAVAFHAACNLTLAFFPL